MMRRFTRCTQQDTSSSHLVGLGLSVSTLLPTGGWIWSRGFAGICLLGDPESLLAYAVSWPYPGVRGHGGTILMELDRWWDLLAPAGFNLEEFATWPCASSHATIEHIIPRWPLWSPAEERCLALTAHEREHYDDPQFGTDVRLLELTSICPTILHSYSNALQTCPCGCRHSPFCRDLLRGGLRGFYVISQVLGTPRYLHVQEAALMLSIPLTMKYPGDARTGLCLLGQSAAPLQALWVATVWCPSRSRLM